MATSTGRCRPATASDRRVDPANEAHGRPLGSSRKGGTADQRPRRHTAPTSATTQSRRNAVATGANGMYAVGEQTGAAGDLDAVLVKF